MEQYAIKKFAEAFEALPRALAENSGVKGSELISKLYAAHHEGNKNMGFDIEVCAESVEECKPYPVYGTQLINMFVFVLLTGRWTSCEGCFGMWYCGALPGEILGHQTGH